MPCFITINFKYEVFNWFFMRRRFTFDTGSKSMHLHIDRAYPNVISGGSPGRVRRIANYLDVEEIVESDRGLVTVHGKYRRLPVTAFSTGMGPSSVAITLPEVIEACDDDNMLILRIGTAGALQEHINVGDFVVTTSVAPALLSFCNAFSARMP